MAWGSRATFFYLEVLLLSERILSCFIDEAGDFGNYEPHSPYYIVSIVLHDQSIPIQDDIDGLETYLSYHNYAHHALHTGPLIRREADYEYLDTETRRSLFNLLFRFARKLPITFCSVNVRKSECRDTDDLESKLAKTLKSELSRNAEYFNSFDKIIVYYDNGQKNLKRIINILFNTLFSNVEIRKVRPSDYKLFQVADLICTLDHLKCKSDIGLFSNSEKEFFSSRQNFYKNYFRKIETKRMS